MSGMQVMNQKVAVVKHDGAKWVTFTSPANDTKAQPHDSQRERDATNTIFILIAAQDVPMICSQEDWWSYQQEVEDSDSPFGFIRSVQLRPVTQFNSPLGVSTVESQRTKEADMMMVFETYLMIVFGLKCPTISLEHLRFLVT